jgi:elongation factor Ts
MANYTAQDVKKLREDTDAPMMECKAALDEANGDFEKAKNILREKGKAAAAKRTDRTTAAGVVALATNSDNESVDEASIKEITDGAVAKIRENIKVTKSLRVVSINPIATYVHHDRTKGSLVVSEGELSDAVRKVAIQIVAFPPDVLKKSDLSQDKLDSEIEIETQRAINEGKDEKLARNIATGRVNKEFVKRAVLLEQPYYVDPSKSVAQFLAEEAKGTTLVSFAYLAVGQGA